ncbi:unnamed protein product [Rotaria socialis]|uniref:Uncharacterized protein n=1 Tax=Rotaria socialis TaxID=392032 RepID=A0A817R440_9BILA|nr:unnamed protein product [Rotaria socialis]CAF4298536.1 unnamed protein product [Rotaria socialis]
METRRFEITPVVESNHETSAMQQTEMVPLINIENEIPRPLSTYIASNDGKNKNRTGSRLFSKILQQRYSDIRRRATVAAADDFSSDQITKSSSADIIHQTDSKSTLSLPSRYTNAAIDQQVEEINTYSTIQSNNYDTNPLNVTNKFLQELRLKRRELRNKAKNISIDQRIAFNRRQNQRVIVRAQDIFDVHFETQDEDDTPILESTIFTEEYQEKIRGDIFNELNRQRMKEYRKNQRHLLLGRSLLMFMTVLFLFMSLTLIYVVFDLFGRITYLNAKIPENIFISMTYDQRINLY